MGKRIRSFKSIQMISFFLFVEGFVQTQLLPLGSRRSRQSLSFSPTNIYMIVTVAKREFCRIPCRGFSSEARHLESSRIESLPVTIPANKMTLNSGPYAPASLSFFPFAFFPLPSFLFPNSLLPFFLPLRPCE